MEMEILLYQISLVLAAKFTDKGMVSLRVVPKQSTCISWFPSMLPSR